MTNFIFKTKNKETFIVRFHFIVLINFFNFITAVVYKKLLIPNFQNQLFHYFSKYYFLSNSVRVNAQNIDTLSVNENYIIKANSTLNSKTINTTSNNNTINDKSGTSDNVPWPSKVKLDLRSRTKIANDSNADYLISIHNNDSKLTSSNGTQTFFSYNSTKGKYLANSVQNELIKSVGLQNRGIVPANYYVLGHTSAVSILTELAFISNPKEDNILNNTVYQNKFTNALDFGIVNAISNKNS